MKTRFFSLSCALIFGMGGTAFAQQDSQSQQQQDFESYRQQVESDFRDFALQRERELQALEQEYQNYFNQLHDLKQHYEQTGDLENAALVDDMISYEEQIAEAAGKNLQATTAPLPESPEPAITPKSEPEPKIPVRPRPQQEETEQPVADPKPATTLVPLPNEGDRVPVLTPVPQNKARVTSPFGLRNHPVLKRQKMHNGIDFGTGFNANVYAAADGRVLLARYSQSFGNWIMIEHENGYTSVYAHLNSMDVRKGQRVRKGDRIGLTGSTGRSTGPHLHYEVRLNGTPVNPNGYMTGYVD